MIFATLPIDVFGPGRTQIINHSKRGRGGWRPTPGDMISVNLDYEKGPDRLDQFEDHVGTVISVSILSHYNGFVTELNNVDVLWI